MAWQENLKILSSIPSILKKHPVSGPWRLFQPAGFVFLLFPGLWGFMAALPGTRIGEGCQVLRGAALSWSFLPLSGLALLFLGSFWARAMGCWINEWVDRPFDAQVQRCAQRTLVRISRLAPPHVAALILLFLIPSIFFLCLSPWIVSLLGFLGVLGATLYPFAKRKGFWGPQPQVLLGILFSLNVWMGYFLGAAWPRLWDIDFNGKGVLLLPSGALNITTFLILVVLFVYNVVFVLSYDSIYGYQDYAQDRLLGLRSVLMKKAQARATPGEALYNLMVRWRVIRALLLALLGLLYFSLHFPNHRAISGKNLLFTISGPMLSVSRLGFFAMAALFIGLFFRLRMGLPAKALLCEHKPQNGPLGMGYFYAHMREGALMTSYILFLKLWFVFFP